MKRKTLNIGLFGFGCVGFGLFEVLQSTPGLKANIKKIAIRNPGKPRQIGMEHFTTDRFEILNDPDINVVVELIDDSEAAFDIVRTAMQNGKAVVSANKKMIAEHLPELLQLQETCQVPFLYEASCCASIPIIRNLEEYYDNDLLESFEGIVNGSTNYILTQTAENGLSYADALHDAQNKGYAESDPTLDTGGFDAKYKLLILLAHAFGLVVAPNDIHNIGIDRLGDLEINYAREKNLKIKLVAQALKSADNAISAFVMPKFVKKSDKLYNVDDVYNGVITKTSFADTQFFVGKGAGAHPTASAVLSDISALSYDYRYEYKKIHQISGPTALHNALVIRIMLRHRSGETEQLKAYFEQIEETYINRAAAYIIGDIKLEQVAILAQMTETSVVLLEVL